MGHVVTAKLVSKVDPLDQMVTLEMPVWVVKALVAVLGPQSADSHIQHVAGHNGAGDKVKYLKDCKTAGRDWSYELYWGADEALKQAGQQF